LSQIKAITLFDQVFYLVLNGLKALI